jgi:hypothetical protein
LHGLVALKNLLRIAIETNVSWLKCCSRKAVLFITRWLVMKALNHPLRINLNYRLTKDILPEVEEKTESKM